MILLPLCLSSLAFLAYLSLLTPSLVLALLFSGFVCASLVIVNFSSRQKSLLVIICFLASLVLLLHHASSSGAIRAGMEVSSVREVVGTLLDDGTRLRHGGTLLRLRLESARDWYGTSVSADGCVSAILDSSVSVAQGSVMRLRGKVGSGGLFVAKDWQVLSVPLFAEVRMTILRVVSLRLFRSIPSSSALSLSRLLLLGVADGNASSWKDGALESGVSHLLALSGMHLGFLMGLFRDIIGPVASSVFALLFVLVIGSKPSLIRAVIGLFLHFFIKGRRSAPVDVLSLTMAIHIALFPHHVTSLGFLLSYLGMSAVVITLALFPSIHPLLWTPLVSVFSTVLTSPVTLFVLGTGNLAGLLVSPCATILVLAILHLSLFSLVPLPLSVPLLTLSASLLSRLLSLLSVPLDFPGCLLLLFCALGSLLCFFSLRHWRLKRRRHALSRERAERFPC